MTQPIAGPWLSPKVVTVKSFPKALLDMSRSRSRYSIQRFASGSYGVVAFNQITAIDDEDAHLPDIEFDPVERNFGQQFNQCPLALADLDNQHTFVIEMVRRFAQDPQGEIQSILSGGQSQLGLMSIFRRQGVEFLLGDIRRVAHDQVVTLALDPCKQVRFYGAYALADVLVLDVFASQRQGGIADVDQIDLPVGIVRGHRDANATGTRAQVERPKYLAIVQPRRKTGENQLGNRRARNQCAPIRNELQTCEPGLAGQIGHRLTLADPSLEQGQHAPPVRRPSAWPGRRQATGHVADAGSAKPDGSLHQVHCRSCGRRSVRPQRTGWRHSG